MHFQGREGPEKSSIGVLQEMLPIVYDASGEVVLMCLYRYYQIVSSTYCRISKCYVSKCSRTLVPFLGIYR